jgi:hypothetical protein
MVIAIVILFLIVGILSYRVSTITSELRKKTTFYWKMVGDYKVLVNEKGEEITRL